MKKQETYQDLENVNDNPLIYLEEWVFHYNSFANQWAAIPREKYKEYWNDFRHPDVLKSKHLNTLLDLLHKSKGNIEVIEDLTRGEIK
jgi:DNA-directed RNA polymerase subunit F